MISLALDDPEHGEESLVVAHFYGNLAGLFGYSLKQK